ncbi:ArnT family glycosyltransferase [Limnoglobus roseus]|uniref:Uncharacterized protein n=1 Tax=Limnoglobus roseus TaxID=2598579 RepID=A0A5C1AL57_9BACT|nr:glycosyltransferase family 39 protein [Limnoglobus roseus]QEL19680.1 hypothetical protein PX52LOC_06759 [Limnoglobus roseus]
MNLSRPLTHPLVLALLLTLANAVKPAVIDDTAYLLFARHLSQHPLDPYGFDLFWYLEPLPAMMIILPPVVPYWLAAGVTLFGENLLLLKFWLFPFAAILAYAARFLVRRFVRQELPLATALLVLGPGVLPYFNFMLDVPAIAFQLAAVALCVRGTDRDRNRWALVLAGVCLALALQTKYSVLGLPAVLLAVAFLRRASVAGLVPVGVGLALFAGWEFYLISQYGQSHFLYHLTRKGGESGGVIGFISQKTPLILPLFAYLGATAGWVGVFGLARVVSPRVLRAVVALLVVLALVIAFVPGRWTLISSKPPSQDPTGLADIYFRAVGGLAFVVGVRFAAITAFRSWGVVLRRSWESRFLLAWFLLELGAYFAVTPFPAGRRVLGVTAVLTLIALRLGTRLARIEPRMKAASWVLALGLLSGVAVAAIDTWDALPERELPRRAADVTRERGWTGTGYFVGHWGYQYYAEQAGMRILVPGRTVLQPGDWLVLPVNPDGRDFYRPNGADIILNPNAVEPAVTLVWDDIVAAQTIPNLYAGRTPILGITHPRLAVTVYRVTAMWTPLPVPE